MVKLTIKIEIELLGALRKIVGNDLFSLEFDDSTAVRDVIAELTNLLSSRFKQVLVDPELNDPRPNVIILLNKVEIGVLKGLDTEVENGDKLVLIPVTHGG